MEIRTTLKSARIKVMGNPASIPTAQSSITNNLITPEPANSPNDEWCNTAKAFLNWSIFNMWDEKYCQGLDYLSSRKIDDEAILRYSIGYNPTTMYRPKIKWGISDDESSMLVIPEGIVIPYFVDGKIWIIVAPHVHKIIPILSVRFGVVSMYSLFLYALFDFGKKFIVFLRMMNTSNMKLYKFILNN